MSKTLKQSTDHILMVEPVNFHSNPETKGSNSHQADNPPDIEKIQERAEEEHQFFRDLLVSHGVKVTHVRGRPDTPDGLFCNNWVSTHQDKTFSLYPMLAPNRRIERRPDIIKDLKKTYKLDLDLSTHEARGKFLESTGSLVLDRVHKVAYAARSPRTDEGLAKEWCQKKGYELVIFDALDVHGDPEYHTNVIMFIGTEVAGICLECIPLKDRLAVQNKLSKTHKVIELSREQIQHFCGNALEVTSVAGDRLLAMSLEAYRHFMPDQKKFLDQHYSKVLRSDLSTIETYGGGSARCMMLELF